jgi:5'(3')-deoxyribonucleotidase
MMKAKISYNMISFITVRRGDWILKVSVYKGKQIMIVAQHCYDLENVIVNFFTNQNNAADYIECLIKE